MADRNKGIARTLTKLGATKGDYCFKQLFSTITSLSKMEASLERKNLRLEGSNSFL